IWTLPQVKELFTRCTVVKNFTWFVATLALCIGVRHAQGFHNVEGDKNPDSYVSYDLFDASLTPLGWKQVDNLREHVKASGLSKRVQLVVVSPLSRRNVMM
ncbi:phosphoglycerate mutase-like protein, partial [Trifolium medium]|nr:phosphoglycerate mutase-like protein [Trifolium medium]